MELTEEQIDWLVEHYVNPGRARGEMPLLEQSLLDLGLIKSECFPVGDTNIYVLSLTDPGWKEAARHRFAEVVEKFANVFSEEAVGRVMFGGLLLGSLPILLSSEEELVRKHASRRLEELKRDSEQGDN